jgi:hypothetical protein
MYAIIGRYQTDSASELNKAVTEKFVPRIKHLPGFVAYYGIDSGDGVWSSVSVFDSKANARHRFNWRVTSSRKTISP